MNFQKILADASKRGDFEKISEEIEKNKKKPQNSNPYTGDLNKKAKEDFLRTWIDRDDFIKWITAMAVGALYFALNKLMTPNEIPFVSARYVFEFSSVSFLHPFFVV